MRAFWSGAISFGLVNIPIKLYSATEEHDLSFNFLHKKDMSPIRFAKICRADGQEISFDEIVRGYEFQKSNYVVLFDEDFEKVDPKKVKSIQIFQFSDEEDIDKILFEKPYYLEPDKGAEKPYSLLREALARSKKVGIAKFVLRNKEHLGAIKAQGEVLVLDQLRFYDEVRDYKILNLPAVKLEKNEIDLALALIDQLSKPFRPEEYKDTYKEELKKIIEAKAKGFIPPPKGEAPTPTEVKDLMEILKASLKKKNIPTGTK